MAGQQSQSHIKLRQYYGEHHTLISRSLDKRRHVDSIYDLSDSLWWDREIAL